MRVNFLTRGGPWRDARAEGKRLGERPHKEAQRALNSVQSAAIEKKNRCVWALRTRWDGGEPSRTCC
jgi:hypothetical protein